MWALFAGGGEGGRGGFGKSGGRGSLHSLGLNFPFAVVSVRLVSRDARHATEDEMPVPRVRPAERAGARSMAECENGDARLAGWLVGQQGVVMPSGAHARGYYRLPSFILAPAGVSMRARGRPDWDHITGGKGGMLS